MTTEQFAHLLCEFADALPVIGKGSLRANCSPLLLIKVRENRPTEHEEYCFDLATYVEQQDFELIFLITNGSRWNLFNLLPVN